MQGYQEACITLHRCLILSQDFAAHHQSSNRIAAPENVLSLLELTHSVACGRFEVLENSCSKHALIQGFKRAPPISGVMLCPSAIKLRLSTKAAGLITDLWAASSSSSHPFPYPVSFTSQINHLYQNLYFRICF